MNLASRRYCPAVSENGAPGKEAVRTAEVIAALCLATDLGDGFPFEHGLHCTIATMRLCDRLGVDAETARQSYYSCLLAYSGCTADAEIAAEVFGDDVSPHLVPVLYGGARENLVAMIGALPTPASAAPARAVQFVRRFPRAVRTHRPHLAAVCDVARMLAERLGLPRSVSDPLTDLTERWDGGGLLGRAQGEGIPIAIRIAHVARDATYQHLLGGIDRAVRVVRRRAGQAFDPEIAAVLAKNAAEILTLELDTSAWMETLDLEPRPLLMLEGEAIDRALAAVGSFADLISPHLAGHSAGVAELAQAAARLMPLDASEVITLRRAALVHDIGRVAVGARTWQRQGPLSAAEWEQVRLHPYHTERVLSRSAFLAALASVAGASHERLDGSGYHRGSSGAELSELARLLAAADVFHALTEPRPHRRPLSPERAAEALGEEAGAGRLDGGAVAAVIEAAGQPVPRIERPGGLTEREVEVVRLLARGLQTKEVARELGIAVKTADRHIQNAYAKIGISSRAGATVFAMEQGLLAWGELPIAHPRVGS